MTILILSTHIQHIASFFAYSVAINFRIHSAKLDGETRSMTLSNRAHMHIAVFTPPIAFKLILIKLEFVFMFECVILTSWMYDLKSAPRLSRDFYDYLVIR